MAITINLRHLELHTLDLKGELTPEEAGLEAPDDLIKPGSPFLYEITAEEQEGGILLQGRLQMDFQCECARCLQPFTLQLDLTQWACLVPLEGEDAPPIHCDSVDLTPYVREDMVLALPQRPLCKPDCVGLPEGPPGTSQTPETASPRVEPSPVWRALDKLRL